MTYSFSDTDITNIVNSVLQNVESCLSDTGRSCSTSMAVCVGGQKGVYEKMEDAIKAAHKSQITFMARCKIADRERFISAIRKATLENKETLAHMVHEETGLGRYEHKISKHELIATKTPGTEDLKTDAISGDCGLTILEYAPFGLIGAVTPVTNPTETLISNSIGMLAVGNAVVFNVHPSSKRSCAFAVDMVNKAIISEGGPENLVTMVREPSLDTLDVMIKSKEVSILLGTGGPGLVKTLLRSGKKAIGAGAGNPPVVVDETADIEHAAKEIIRGAAFDNNILCISEKELFVVNSVADELIFHMLQNGAYMLDKSQVEKVMGFALQRDEKGEYHTVKDWIGKDASLFLRKLGVTDADDVQLLIFETTCENPFVQLEQMMPVLPIVRANDLDEAIEMAVQAEHNNRHTAMMHSRSVENLTKFARIIGSTIFVKNAASPAAVGFGGEGHTSMTIAGPTGEGVTSARTYARIRRCVLAEGGFRIV